MTIEEIMDQWSDRKFVCVLGSGHRPLTNGNKDEFLGLEDVPQVEPTNVDIRNYHTTDVVQDLSLELWDKLPTNYFDIVIIEHCLEHLPNRLWAVKECLRIVKPNGLIIIETPNWSHITAHSNLEHLTTFSRVIFDDSYINEHGMIWKIEKIVYRVTNPITWNSWYIKNEFMGRQLDRLTNFVSGLRFYLRKK